MEAIEESGVEQGWIKIASEVRENALCFFLKDNGGGVAPEAEERLFVPFFTTKDDGVGMGLALAHKIIVSHGGDLALVKRADGIAEFRIELPLDRAAAPAKLKASVAGAKG